MLLKEFSNSAKTKLYDFTYTPFLSSMVIAWIVLNHKYILIYVSSFDLEKKLALLKQYDFALHTPWIDIPYAYNVFLPILFGLFYTFVYPLFSKYFYQYTLNKNRHLKTIKVDIEDSTPVTLEEAKAIKSENYSKTEKILELKEKISNRGAENDKNIEAVKGQKEERDVLNFFYEAKGDKVSLDTIVSDTGIVRPKVQQIINKLVKDQVLKKSGKYLSITERGNDYLVKLFYK